MPPPRAWLMAASPCSMPSPRHHPPCRCPTARSRSKVREGSGLKTVGPFLPSTGTQMCPSSNTEMHSPLLLMSLPTPTYIPAQIHRLRYSHTHWTIVLVHLDTHAHLNPRTTGTLVHCMRHFGAHILCHMSKAPQSLIYITPPLSRDPPEHENEYFSCFSMQVVSLRCS